MSQIIKTISLVVALVISGCATTGSHIDNMLNRGDFVSAYKYAIVRGEKVRNRSEFVNSLKSHSSGFTSEKFYNSAKLDIIGGHRSESNFIDFANLITLSEQDRLISATQAIALKAELLYVVELQSFYDPAILKSAPLKFALPSLGTAEGKADIIKYKLLPISEKPNAKLIELVPFFRVSSSLIDQNLLSQLKSIGSSLFEREISALSSNASQIAFSDFSPLVYYSNFSKSEKLSERLKIISSRVSFTKSDLKSQEMEQFDSEFVKRELVIRTIKFKVVIEPDDGAFQEDISKLLLNKNEWVQIDDESKNTLIIKRQRFLENLGNPSGGTEIVPDPNFVTLLFIPKNASVLFDYVSTEYRIDYSIDVSLSSKLARKNVRGTDTLKRTECRNIRYQNVFGGVGSINAFPNDRVQSFCTSSNGNSFDSLRSRVLDKIATEINDSVLIK
jgi:hypothetical protein